MTYVRWPSKRPDRGSFHIYVTYTRGGQTLVRCGRRITGTPTAVDNLPANERTCETCLRSAVRDADPPDVANDEVPF